VDDGVVEALERLRARSSPRHEVLWEIAQVPEASDALRAVRRHGPGRLRRSALDALMYLGGESALDPVDVRAVEQLIRIRRRVDAFGGVMSCWTQWWCVRSKDQAAVMATLGLTNVRPVTYSLACRWCLVPIGAVVVTGMLGDTNVAMAWLARLARYPIHLYWFRGQHRTGGRDVNHRFAVAAL
jgi:hypothetical protein